MTPEDFSTQQSFASRQDAADELAVYRDHFFYPEAKIYVDGNSLGLMSRASAGDVERVAAEWQALAIDGWEQGSPPWLGVGERIGALAAPLVGAERDSVACTGTTTINLHALAGTFYQPREGRDVLLTDNVTFPTDQYALHAQVARRGLDTGRALRFVPVNDKGLVDEAGAIAAMDDDVAAVILSSVIYSTGQLLNVERLTAAARDRGIVVGWDCSHSVGALPHAFDEWGVDFAFWCGYKYLNGGPGSPAFLYVNPRHAEVKTALPGWWGFVKEKQFDLLREFEQAAGAAGWQISSPSPLAAAPLEASLALLNEAGIDRIRDKSLGMTTYLIAMVDAELAPHGFGTATPREPAQRGGHVSITHPRAREVFDALLEHGVVGDYRPPNLIRIAPVALYNTYEEIWHIVQHLKSIAAEL